MAFVEIKRTPGNFRKFGTGDAVYINKSTVSLGHGTFMRLGIQAEQQASGEYRANFGLAVDVDTKQIQLLTDVQGFAWRSLTGNHWRTGTPGQLRRLVEEEKLPRGAYKLSDVKELIFDYKGDE